MRNIGPVSGQWLKDIGIETVEDIQKQGIANIYVQLKLEGKNVNRAMMWALWGAVNDTHWTQTPEAEKDRRTAEAENILGD